MFTPWYGCVNLGNHHFQHERVIINAVIYTKIVHMSVLQMTFIFFYLTITDICVRQKLTLQSDYILMLTGVPPNT